MKSHRTDTKERKVPNPSIHSVKEHFLLSICLTQKLRRSIVIGLLCGRSISVKSSGASLRPY